MEKMKFDWNKLNIEQKVDIAFVFALFSIITTFAFAIFSLSLAYSSSTLFVVSFVIFFIGLYLVWRFLKRTGQVKRGGKPAPVFQKKPQSANTFLKESIFANAELQEYNE